MIFPRLWSKKRTSQDLREKEDWWPSWQGQDGRSRNVALLSGKQLVVLMLWMVLEFRFTWNVQYLGFSLPAKNTKHFQKVSPCDLRFSDMFPTNSIRKKVERYLNNKEKAKKKQQLKANKKVKVASKVIDGGKNKESTEQISLFWFLAPRSWEEFVF